MIRLLETESPSFAAFCGRDALGARVLAALRSYAGIDARGAAQFWVQEDAQSQPVAALSLIDGFGVLCAGVQAVWEELTAFLRMQHGAGQWHRLQCNARLAPPLPFREASRSSVLRFQAPLRSPLAGMRIIPAEDLREVYAMLERCFPNVKNRELWLADVALRKRRGTAQSWFLFRDNAALCTLSALAVTETITYLGAAGTVPEARGQGLAGELLARVAEAEQARGRAVWLSCQSELLGFYRSVGFEEADEWVMLGA